MELIAQALWTFIVLVGTIGIGSVGFRSLAWDVAFGLGICWLSLVGLCLSYFSWIQGLVLVVLFGWSRVSAIERPKISGRMWAGVGVFGFALLVAATAETVDTDALYYHISLPLEFGRTGELIGGELRPNGSRPMTAHIWFSLASLWGERGVSWLTVLPSLVLCVSMVERSFTANKSLLVIGCCLLGSYSVWMQLFVPSTNVLTALLIWLAYHSRASYFLVGLLLGTAAAVKLTALGVAAGIWVCCVSGLRQRAWALLIGCVPLLPWFLRNAATGDHPLFPYVGWSYSLPFQYLEKYGMGREPLDLLLAFVRAIFQAKIDDYQFMGQLSPATALLIPFGLFYLLRRDEDHVRLCGALVIAIIWWSFGPHWIRHMWPFLPLLCYWGANRSALSVVFVAVFCLGFRSNLQPSGQYWWRAARSIVDEPTNLERKNRYMPSWRAIERLNASECQRSALFFAWEGARVDHSYILGSVEDHTPVRHFLLRHQSNLTAELAKLGVDCVLVGPPPFRKRSYPFLSREEYHQQFEVPLNALETMLLSDSRLLYASGRSRLYRLRQLRLTE